MTRRVWFSVPLLTAAAAGQLVLLELVRRLFVTTARGQRLDTAALSGATIGEHHIDHLVDTVLGAVTVLSLAVATAVIGAIALLRGRWLLAAAGTLLIVGSNVTTQLLKYDTHRPDLGIDVERVAAGNSLPSGHATVAASVAVALVLVLPARVRGTVALLATGYAVAVGVATMPAGWHRPSDVVAALLVVGVWSAVIGLALVLYHHDRQDRVSRSHPVATGLLAATGVAAAAVTLVALALTDRAVADGTRPDRGELFLAYLGGATGIVATASLLTAFLLMTVHVAAPDRPVDEGGRLTREHVTRRPASPARVP